MRYPNMMILLLCVCVLSGCMRAVDEPVVLKDVFASKFMIGVAMNKEQIYGKAPAESALVKRHFNTVTPENILKWEKVHPEPDTYDFGPVDRLMEFAEDNDLFVVGHVLVWHEQTPDWVFEDAEGKPLSRNALLTRMKEHIFTVMGRYKGRIGGWDVVNEAIDDDGNMRKTRWLEIIGPDYVEKAFEYAHEADPNAELYYNDFNMWQTAHLKGVIRLIKDLQRRNIRIDAVGMQLHSGLNYQPYDEMGFYYPRMDMLEKSIIAYAGLGIQVMITELDITTLPKADNYTGADISQCYEFKDGLNPFGDGLPVRIQYRHAACYADLFTVFHKHADKISRVTFWGVQDGNSWFNDWPIKGRTDYPLIFDRQCKPKPAFTAIAKTAEKN